MADKLAAWAAAQADLSGRAVARALEIGGGEGEEHFAQLGVGEFVSLPEPSESLVAEAPFDLVHCSAELETHLHPLSLYAWLRSLVTPGGVLLAGSPILPETANSQYAEYVSGGPGNPTGARWLPGRLAFRWMVEVSGFDVERWLGEPPSSGGDGPPRAYLQATAAERAPALDLSRQPLGR